MADDLDLITALQPQSHVSLGDVVRGGRILFCVRCWEEGEVWSK